MAHLSDEGAISTIDGRLLAQIADRVHGVSTEHEDIQARLHKLEMEMQTQNRPCPNPEGQEFRTWLTLISQRLKALEASSARESSRGSSKGLREQDFKDAQFLLVSLSKRVDRLEEGNALELRKQNEWEESTKKGLKDVQREVQLYHRSQALLQRSSEELKETVSQLETELMKQDKSTGSQRVTNSDVETRNRIQALEKTTQAMDAHIHELARANKSEIQHLENRLHSIDGDIATQMQTAIDTSRSELQACVETLAQELASGSSSWRVLKEDVHDLQSKMETLSLALEVRQALPMGGSLEHASTFSDEMPTSIDVHYEACRHQVAALEQQFKDLQKKVDALQKETMSKKESVQRMANTPLNSSQGTDDLMASVSSKSEAIMERMEKLKALEKNMSTALSRCTRVETSLLDCKAQQQELKNRVGSIQEGMGGIEKTTKRVCDDFWRSIRHKLDTRQKVMTSHPAMESAFMNTQDSILSQIEDMIPSRVEVMLQDTKARIEQLSLASWDLTTQFNAYIGGLPECAPTPTDILNLFDLDVPEVMRRLTKSVPDRMEVLLEAPIFAQILKLLHVVTEGLTPSLTRGLNVPQPHLATPSHTNHDPEPLNHLKPTGGAQNHLDSSKTAPDYPQTYPQSQFNPVAAPDFSQFESLFDISSIPPSQDPGHKTIFQRSNHDDHSQMTGVCAEKDVNPSPPHHSSYLTCTAATRAGTQSPIPSLTRAQVSLHSNPSHQSTIDHSLLYPIYHLTATDPATYGSKHTYNEDGHDSSPSADRIHAHPPSKDHTHSHPSRIQNAFDVPSMARSSGGELSHPNEVASDGIDTLFQPKDRPWESGMHSPPAESAPAPHSTLYLL